MKRGQLCLITSFVLLLLACIPFGSSSPTDTPIPTWTPVPTSTPTPKPTTGGIIGDVIDSLDGSPIPSAGISTDPPIRAVMADAHGTYSISEVPPGTYMVTASRAGYADESVQITVVAGRATIADLNLAPTPVDAIPGPAVAPPPLADGSIVVGTNAEYPPFENVDEYGNLVGFDIEMMEAIAEAGGFGIEWVNTRWDGIFTTLDTGEFDAVCSAARITEDRLKIVDFSDPYFNAGQVIVVRADETEIQVAADLTGKRAGAQLGSTGDIWLTEDLEGVEVVRYDGNTLAIQALADGDVDAVAADNVQVHEIVAANPEMSLEVLPGVYIAESYGIAVNRDKPEVLKAINEGLAAIKADGAYDAIYEKYFGYD